MILDLHRQGLTVSAIARELGLDRKTVRKCIAWAGATGLWSPQATQAFDRSIRPLSARACSGLSRPDRPSAMAGASRAWIRGRLYRHHRPAASDIRPAPSPAFEVCFET